MKWTEDKKATVRRLLRKVRTIQKTPHARLLTFAQLKNILAHDEWGVIQELLACNPKQFGFRGPYYSIRELKPTQLVHIPAQNAEGAQYVRSTVHKDLLSMLRAITNDTDRNVYVISAYRSPAYQTILFFDLLTKHNFRMNQVCRRVALPGWSEHGAPMHQAVDLEVRWSKGETKRSFGQTMAYRWLKRNAARYNFYLSYPRSNPYGVMFEPWHWHWENKS